MITAGIWLALVLAAALLLAATSALVVQAAAASFKPEKPVVDGPRPPCLVLVPAHNEAGGIADTVRALIAELSRSERQAADRLLVIADNCSDDTAALAAMAGADVLIRNDAERRGKGFALSAGLRHAIENWQGSAAVMVFVDADCRFAPGGLDALVRACAAHDAPVQCRNLMVQRPDQAIQLQPDGGAHHHTARPAAMSVRHALAEFAWRVRNDFRPTGYARLGLPCQLFGTGMAMPARLAMPDRFATGHVTEDLLIGVEAALEGSAPRYVRNVSLYSYFPDTAKGARQQKKRWIHGHMAVILSHAPKLIGLGLWHRDRNLLAMGADLLTPPLTLLAAGHLGLMLAACGFFALTGFTLPMIMALTGLVLFGFAMHAAWRFCGRELIGWREIFQIPRHALGVVSATLGFASGNRSAWVRADRTHVR